MKSLMQSPCFLILKCWCSTTSRLRLAGCVSMAGDWQGILRTWELNCQIQSFPSLQGRALRSNVCFPPPAPLLHSWKLRDWSQRTNFHKYSYVLNSSRVGIVLHTFLCFPTKALGFVRLYPCNFIADWLLVLLCSNPLFKNSHPRKALGFIR